MKWKIKRRISWVLITVMLFTLIPTNIKTTHAATGADLTVGKYIKFGSYLGEPITWRVLERDGSKALLLTDKIITLKAFDATTDTVAEPDIPTDAVTDGNRDNYGSNFWKNSTLRKWLNTSGPVSYAPYSAPNANNVWIADDGVAINPYATENGFLTGFSPDEKLNIVRTTNDSAQSTTVSDGDSITEDDVFLLSEAELSKIVATYESIIAYTTAAAREQSNDESGPEDDSTAWHYWTRDAYTAGSSNVRRVRTDGAVGSSYAYVGRYGVRPALWLDTSSLTLADVIGDTEATAYTVTSYGSTPEGYAEGTTPTDRKNFKYYLGRDKNGITKVMLVNPTAKNVGFEKNDILDGNNKYRDGIYYIDRDGKIKQYSAN